MVNTLPPLLFLFHLFLTPALWENIIQNLEFMSREHKVQQFPNSNEQDQHDWKQNGGLFECLDEPEDDEAGQLDDCKEMDSDQGDLSQIWMVWLILLGHEEQEEPVKELETIQ